MTDFFVQNAPLIGMIAFFMLAIVVLGIGSEVFKRWLEHKEVMAEKLNAQAAEKAAQYAADNARLEGRVRTLERIVTDGGNELSNEIEALRDAPALPQRAN
jgi:hypothetical protein